MIGLYVFNFGRMYYILIRNENRSLWHALVMRVFPLNCVGDFLALPVAEIEEH